VLTKISFVKKQGFQSKDFEYIKGFFRCYLFLINNPQGNSLTKSEGDEKLTLLPSS